MNERSERWLNVDLPAATLEAIVARATVPEPASSANNRWAAPISRGMTNEHETSQVQLALLTRTETAEVMRQSVQTVDRLRKSGQLRSVQIGRRILHDAADVKAFIEASKAMRS